MMLQEFDYSTLRNQSREGKSLSTYVCNFKGCNKEFTRKGNLLDHARMHAGIKPFQCEHWNKSFTQKSNLRKHVKVHLHPNLEDRKRYSWDDWGCSYTERYNYMVMILQKFASLFEFTQFIKSLVFQPLIWIDLSMFADNNYNIDAQPYNQFISKRWSNCIRITVFWVYIAKCSFD